MLGGIAAGWAAVPPRTRWAHAARAALMLGTLAAIPDLDLLVNEHRGPSHSVGAAILAGLLALAVTRNVRWGIAATLAWSSHVLLDWLGNDTFPPIGIMALWPVSHDYYQSSLHLFPAVSRSYWLAEFWVYNMRAAAVELCLVGPIAAAVVVFTQPRRDRT
jgi:membrane-bound metal-dependent hydrolase YbcI (DUF457 family)